MDGVRAPWRTTITDVNGLFDKEIKSNAIDNFKSSRQKYIEENLLLPRSVGGIVKGISGKPF